MIVNFQTRDSGGPIQYIGAIDNKPKMIQFGIVSFGVKSCGGELEFSCNSTPSRCHLIMFIFFSFKLLMDIQEFTQKYLII